MYKCYLNSILYYNMNIKILNPVWKLYKLYIQMSVHASVPVCQAMLTAVSV